MESLLSSEEDEEEDEEVGLMTVVAVWMVASDLELEVVELWGVKSFDSDEDEDEDKVDDFVVSVEEKTTSWSSRAISCERCLATAFSLFREPWFELMRTFACLPAGKRRDVLVTSWSWATFLSPAENLLVIEAPIWKRREKQYKQKRKQTVGWRPIHTNSNNRHEAASPLKKGK
jgi:hypothetical protein